MISTTVLKTLSEKIWLNFGYENQEENAEGDTIVLIVMSSFQCYGLASLLLWRLLEKSLWQSILSVVVSQAFSNGEGR